MKKAKPYKGLGRNPNSKIRQARGIHGLGHARKLGTDSVRNVRVQGNQQTRAGKGGIQQADNKPVQVDVLDLLFPKEVEGHPYKLTLRKLNGEWFGKFQQAYINELEGGEAWEVIGDVDSEVVVEIGDSWWTNVKTTRVGVITETDWVKNNEESTIEFAEPTETDLGKEGDYWLKVLEVEADEDGAPKVKYYLEDDLIWDFRQWKNVGGGREVFARFDEHFYLLRSFIDYEADDYGELPEGFDSTAFEMMEFPVKNSFIYAGDAIQCITTASVPVPKGFTGYTQWTNDSTTDQMDMSRGIVTDSFLQHDSCDCEPATTVEGPPV